MIRLAVRVFQRLPGRFDGQRRRVPGETGLQRVGCQIENLRQRFERQMARINAVVAAENFFQEGAGARLELWKLCGVLERVPTLALGDTLRRGGGSKSNNKHE